jgi:outer membrane receptor protein involved in Fe transport
VNASALSARYTDSHQLVQNSPKHTEGVGVNYTDSGFTASLFVRHAASMFLDNGSVHEAIPIGAITVTNFSLGWAVRNPAAFSKKMRIQLSVSNLFDNHNITSVAPASKSSNLPSPNDQVTLLAGRSAALTFTFDVAPK